MSYSNPYGSAGYAGQPSYAATGANAYGQPVAGGSSAGYPSYNGASDSQRMEMLAAETQRAAFQAEMAQQSSIYTPEAAKKGGYQYGGKGKARQTVLRKAGGETWEDPTLAEWDPSWFRLFIGDLDPALSDDLFNKAFNNERYPSFMKGKIIRDKTTNKGKGFGFVAYKDSEDFLKVWKEMNGKRCLLQLKNDTVANEGGHARQVRRFAPSLDLARADGRPSGPDRDKEGQDDRCEAPQKVGHRSVLALEGDRASTTNRFGRVRPNQRSQELHSSLRSCFFVVTTTAPTFHLLPFTCNIVQ